LRAKKAVTHRRAVEPLGRGISNVIRTLPLALLSGKVHLGAGWWKGMSMLIGKRK